MEASEAITSQLPPDEPPPSRSSFAPRRKRRFPWGTAIFALLVIVACAGVLYAFSGARVEVTPSTNAAFVTGEFTATAGAGDLPFEVVTVEKIASQSVKAESTEEANDPAQGSITIYNEQGTSQTLIKNTRFQIAAGLVFRIRNSVTIPGGSAAAPGTLTTTVYADEGGDRYNIGPSDFKVPGLSGSDAYDKVYAKSAEAMTGGFTGTRASVSDGTREGIAATMDSALRADLEAEIREKVPAGYVLIPGATYVTVDAQPDTSGAAGSVDVRLKGTMYAVVFPEEALGRSIAYQVLGTYSGQPIRVGDPASLALTPASAEPPIGAESFAFTLNGDTTLVWSVNTEQIAGAVAGKGRQGAEVVLSGFPEVDRAELILKPFWSTQFPSDPSKITVVVEEAGK